jgi:hypothetical protein
MQIDTDTLYAFREKVENTIKQINKDLNLLEEKVDINPTIYSWVNKLSQVCISICILFHRIDCFKTK